MKPKFRAWLKKLEWMCDVTSIMYDIETIEICQQGDEDRYTEMSVDFDDVILMQSTGLFDKNGVEIFEGDIIDTTDYEGGLISVGNPLVEIRRDNYGFTVVGDFPISPITLKDFEDGRKLAGVDVSVIGNIYKNPELLEEKDEN